ncbi:DNA topoisomerase 2-associated protein pat1 [Dimargaris cristalligena]|uniref:Topoisomerase II-associated protein PAT1 n=1 Tax=Dimargaris cristalligena TaxID=215637 RepID=A0A4P9ZX50_9FUNG|nr:DNA topoisomerase 2-associated protein pat1 [Dimargaris cristalligena]RKP37581.1 topoisomerase II-associated protein PAT1 [Dimargaris cristalligena]|eukprot:RKP37581.1 topoisomerase II-associated protein PAT1 [Dimargaris cristalligena]
MGDSFFGFDTALPRDSDRRPGGSGNRKASVDDIDSRLARVELEPEYGLADQLEDDGDDLNDETFGCEAEDINQDFDFSGNTNKAGAFLGGDEHGSALPPPPSSSSTGATGNGNHHGASALPSTATWSNPAGMYMPPTGPAALGQPPHSQSNDSLGQSIFVGSEPMGYGQQQQARAPPPGFNHHLSPAPGMMPPNFGMPNPTGVQIDQPQQQQQQLHQFYPQHPPMHSNLHASSSPQGTPATSAAAPRSATRPKKIMSLEEVEQTLLQSAKLSQADRQRQQVREQRRQEREKRMAAMSKYNNLMTRFDKEHITRIQISQLVTDDPYADDFYCQMYTVVRNPISNHGVGGNSSQPQQNHLYLPGPGGESHAHDSIHSGRGSRGRHQHGVNRGPNGMHSMQQQIQRMVNEAKRKPKGSAMNLEGALGTIAIHSVRNPKQAIRMAGKTATSAAASSEATTPTISTDKGAGEGGNVDLFTSASALTNPSENPTIRSAPAEPTNAAIKTPAADRRSSLMRIERAFQCILQLEQLMRLHSRFGQPGFPFNAAQGGSHEGGGDHTSPVANNTPHTTEGGPNSTATGTNPNEPDLAAQEAELKQQLWEALQVTPTISDIYPHPLVRFLEPSKGKKLVPRIYHHLTADQILAFVTTLVANFESLDVCRSHFGFGFGGSLSTALSEENQLFMNAVLPSVMATLTEVVPLTTVNQLFALLLERNNIPWIARSKAGLSLLTVFISRGEALRQQQQQQQQQGGLGTSEELTQFEQLYHRLFATLRSYFATLFPATSLSSSLLSPTTPNSNGAGASADSTNGAPSASSSSVAAAAAINNDLYIWQFLAAMAVGATPEQQHALVTEVREKVMELIGLATSNRVGAAQSTQLIANVNLFLHALGLDATQLISA